MDVDSATDAPAAEKRYFIDTVNLKVPRKGTEVVSFLKDGMSEYSTIQNTHTYIYTYIHTCMEMNAFNFFGFWQKHFLSGTKVSFLFRFNIFVIYFI